MKQLALLFTLLLIICSQKNTACNCDSTGNFLRVAPNTALVALVKITKQLAINNRYGRSAAMEAEIIERYKGNETRKTITFWGSTGKDCRPLSKQFTLGNYYVIAMDKGFDDGFEKATDYTTSVCGVHWLDVDMKSHTASGDIAVKQKEMLLTDLKAKLTGK